MAMALRPIDNALPTTPERPKKQTKVAVPMQKQQSGLVNDENQAPLPATADSAIDYISSENLKPFSDPDLKIQSLSEGLESKDWVKVCESLNNVRRFALHHSALLAPTLENVVVVLVKAMKNPRSALIKTSIMASSDIFTAFGDGLLDSAASNAFDQLLLQLLLKASQDKRFVCEEADRALSSMVQSLTPLPLLQKLRAYASHGNPRVRAKAAISIASCVAKMGLEGMKDYGLVSLVQMAADLLNDRLPEAREAARGIVMSVYNAYTENEEEKLRENEEEKPEKQQIWLNFCQSNLSTIHAQSMVKITSSQ
ncbi:protein FAM179A [Pyrus ussuriensis x Pyrus communis]|uniref:Protein FAM179A n=1 Tax=Pyrus ussuriensis x Pyrus communis TaxID=2448454 RepID=A0A5N5FE10_9ROSA|nr:protein FAM179A [Pyrus ussuriensis x Pyrus communis]